MSFQSRVCEVKMEVDLSKKRKLENGSQSDGECEKQESQGIYLDKAFFQEIFDCWMSAHAYELLQKSLSEKQKKPAYRRQNAQFLEKDF